MPKITKIFIEFHPAEIGVQAAPADVDMIESILQILDRPGSPEDVPAEPKPRLIPVVHMAASEIAEVVKEVYKERFSSGNTRSASQAEQMMRMLRRGRGRPSPPQNGSGANKSKDNAPKMSIGVDSRTNSLIVLAPQPLFEEVRELVQSLDRMAAAGSEIVEVVRLSNSNPKAMQETLSMLLGDSVQSTSGSSISRSSRESSRNQSRQGRRQSQGSRTRISGRR